MQRGEELYSQGADAYVQQIVKEYLDAYYGDFADDVANVINYYQNAYGGVVIGQNKAFKQISRNNHATAMTYIDNAIARCSDQVILKRLYAIKASCLAGMWQTATTSKQKTADKADFKTYAALAGITVWSEGVLIENL